MSTWRRSLCDSFSAEVRQRCKETVDEVILELGLKECSDTLVGTDSGAETGGVVGQRGISGGEKRRVSVAIQILSSPEVGKLEYVHYNRWLNTLLRFASMLFIGFLLYVRSFCLLF